MSCATLCTLVTPRMLTHMTPVAIHPHPTGLESALARLRELEREQQQLEARVNDLQEENLELSTEVRSTAAGSLLALHPCVLWVMYSWSAAVPLVPNLVCCLCSLQRSGVTETRRQLEVQLTEAATANNAISAQVRVQQAWDALLTGTGSASWIA